MGSSSTDQNKTKRRSQLWKKALLHSCLCFVMGFFSGFAPSSVSDWTVAGAGGVSSSHVVAALHPVGAAAAANRSLLAQFHAGVERGGADEVTAPRPLLIVVTTTESAAGPRRAAALTRMAHTLRLVAPPLLWVVVEAAGDVPATAPLLRATGVMYRHLAYKENVTAAAEAAHHQRNVALGHVEHHRLAGVVLFAGLANAYDLQFFEQLRELSVFGAWPVATISGKESKVVVEGPICSSSKITGWFSKDFGGKMAAAAAAAAGGSRDYAIVVSRPPTINPYGFAFNSSVLWDPERWGRHPTSEPDTSQDSMKFVQEVVLEDQSKLRGIPSDCSEVMVWQVDRPNSLSQPPQEKRRW